MVIVLEKVNKFVKSLDSRPRSDTRKILGLLDKSSHQLGMPHTKPVGHGLWELRVRTRPAVRILYAFQRGVPVLLVGFIKQRPEIPHDILKEAQKRFQEFCGG
jgi:phage-related protein